MQTVLAQENKAEKFEHWVVIELFGHSRIAGWATEASIGGCNFIRVDVPKSGANPIGSLGVDETLYTRYLGNGAIYALNPTTKEEVLKIVGMLHPPPPTPRVHEQRALPIYDEDDEDDPERPF